MGSLRLLRSLQRPRNYQSQFVLQPSFRYMNTTSNAHIHLPDPSPSNVLRATLLGSVTSKTEDESNAERNRRVLELLDSQWQRGNPPASLWYALKGVPSINYKDGRLTSIASLSNLKDATERLVVNVNGAKILQDSLGQIISLCNSRHPSAEILSTLGDILVRLQRSKLPISPTILEHGMYLAAQNLSSPIFHRFFTHFLELGVHQSKIEKSSEIVQVLYDAIRQQLFENPHYDTTHILAEITGEYDAISDRRIVRLHGLLHSTAQSDRDSSSMGMQSWTKYLCLLSILQSTEPLIISWKRFLERFSETNEETLHSMYTVVLDLIRARRSETAARFLEDISIHNQDKLPHISTFGHLQEVLDDSFVCETLADIAGADQYKELLELAFQNMERRLGLEWKETREGNGAHLGITADSSWPIFEDQPLLTIDGDCAGYDHPSRLWAELEASGCSHSPFQLGQIVDLLHEHDGSGFKVVLEGIDQPGRPELRWCPQHSPIEFSHSQLPPLSDRSQEWTPVSLGLIWLRPLIKGAPQARGKSYHFMQLGSLEMRYGPNERWQPSGYIVCWDRQLGHMNAVFVGTDHGVIDRGSIPSDAPFGTLTRIRLSHMPESEPWISVDRFHLDLDPSLDLGFQ